RGQPQHRRAGRLVRALPGPRHLHRPARHQPPGGRAAGPARSSHAPLVRSAEVGAAPPLLAVSGLTVRVPRATGFPQEAVRDVSFRLAAGRVLAMVGESGSGKTMIARTILN